MQVGIVLRISANISWHKGNKCVFRNRSVYDQNIKNCISGILESHDILQGKSIQKDVGKNLHPTFPGKGQLILGQEQEKPCAGFDDTDSLSADVSQFQVFPIEFGDLLQEN